MTQGKGTLQGASRHGSEALRNVEVFTPTPSDINALASRKFGLLLRRGKAKRVKFFVVISSASCGERMRVSSLAGMFSVMVALVHQLPTPFFPLQRRTTIPLNKSGDWLLPHSQVAVKTTYNPHVIESQLEQLCSKCQYPHASLPLDSDAPP